MCDNSDLSSKEHQLDWRWRLVTLLSDRRLPIIKTTGGKQPNAFRFLPVCVLRLFITACVNVMGLWWESSPVWAEWSYHHHYISRTQVSVIQGEQTTWRQSRGKADEAKLHPVLKSDEGNMSVERWLVCYYSHVYFLLSRIMPQDKHRLSFVLRQSSSLNWTWYSQGAQSLIRKLMI